MKTCPENIITPWACNESIVKPITMDQKVYLIQVLETSPDLVKVKFPFLDIPVEMNYRFFKTHLEKGYLKIQKEEAIPPSGFFNQQVKGAA